jgi:uncharacterized protein RhaS with RHS repeats
LMYYRARYYNPSWGRFISEDPSGFAGGINPYLYAENNPADLTDADGLMPGSTGGIMVWLGNIGRTRPVRIIVKTIEALGGVHDSVTNPIGDTTPAGEPPPIKLVRGPTPYPTPAPTAPNQIGVPRGGYRPGARFSGGGYGRSTGSGGAAGAIVTIGYGAGVLADGIDKVVLYIRNNVAPGYKAIDAANNGTPDNGRW